MDLLRISSLSTFFKNFGGTFKFFMEAPSELLCCALDPYGQTSVQSQYNYFHLRKCIWKCCLQMSAIFETSICPLTYCDLVMPYAPQIWVKIGLGNGLLPDGTKPLPKPILTNHQIHTRSISQDVLQPSITPIRLEITYLNSLRLSDAYMHQ